MKACAVVLYIAVLLCSLNSAFAACNNNGDVLSGFSTCVCKSGFSGADCITPADASCEVVTPITDAVENFPLLVNESTSFRSNNLYAEIRGPHVLNRTYLELNFAGAKENTCSFGTGASSYWSIQQNCNDSFFLVLPWVNHQDCGFAKNDAKTDAQHLVITGSLHLKYKDFVYVPLGKDENNVEQFYTLERLITVPYNMSVSFQKTIEVKLLALNITSDVVFGAALTTDEWDPENGVLTLVITTLINYPNSFGTYSGRLETPGNVSRAGDVTFKPDAEGKETYGSVCPWDQDKPCQQLWYMNVTNNASCTFDGAYYLTLELFTCRDTQTSGDFMACTSTPAVVNFNISTNYICGEIGITPGVSGKLIPFMNKTNVDETNYEDFKKDTFKLGEYGNFYAQIDSDGNDIYINFTTIRFRPKESQSDSDWVNLWENSQHVDVGNNKNAQLQVFHSKKYFKLYFHSSVFAVMPQINPNGPSTKRSYTFSAIVDILFEGNQGEQKKRTVEYTFEKNQVFPTADIALTEAHVAPTTQVKNQDNVPGVSQATFVSATVGAIAGTMIIVFVVVGVALRTRSQSGKRDAAASAAVVAASAAAVDVARV